jgi:hypothetical protein
MTSHCEDLVGLSMSELHRETQRRARLEKKYTVRLVASLSEVDRREVFLAEGYSCLLIIASDFSV